MSSGGGGGGFERFLFGLHSKGDSSLVDNAPGGRRIGRVLVLAIILKWLAGHSYSLVRGVDLRLFVSNFIVQESERVRGQILKCS